MLVEARGVLTRTVFIRASNRGGGPAGAFLEALLTASELAGGAIV